MAKFWNCLDVFIISKSFNPNLIIWNAIGQFYCCCKWPNIQQNYGYTANWTFYCKNLSVIVFSFSLYTTSIVLPRPQAQQDSLSCCVHCLFRTLNLAIMVKHTQVCNRLFHYSPIFKNIRSLITLSGLIGRFQCTALSLK